MIKTHRPTGHFWTCPSEFQQSKKYRDIKTEDFATPFASPIVVDTDEPSTKSGRAAKRRRLVELAKGFLDGHALYISSAEANGAELRSSVDDVLKARKLSRDDLELDAEEDPLNGEKDGWELLRTQNVRRRQSKAAPQLIPRPDFHKILPDVPERTRSTTVPLSRRSRPHISTTPSAAALARAAELRSRRALLAEQDSRQIVPSISVPIVVPQSAPTSARVTRNSSRLYDASGHLQPGTPADNSLADELRLSRTESPFRRPKAFVIVPTESISFTSNDTVEDTPGRNCVFGANVELGEPAIDLRSPEIDETHLAIQTELNDVDDEYGGAAGSDQMTSSTASGFGSTAMSLCTVFPRSTTNNAVDGLIPKEVEPTAVPIRRWNAINDPDLQRSRPPLTTNANCSPGDQSTSQAAGHPLLVSAEGSAVRQPRSARATGASRSTRTNKNARRGKASAVLQNSINTASPDGQQGLLGAFKSSKSREYIAAPASQNGTTPFVYRKKVKVVQTQSPQTPCESEAQHHGGILPPMDPSVIGGDETILPTRSHGKAPMTSADPPVLDMSFGDDSSFAPRLNMALVDEHLNHRLPTSPDSGRRSSSIRKALKDQMRTNNAEFERAPGDPSSSQLLGSDDPFTMNEAIDEREDRRRISVMGCRSTVLWPGTQVLLNQAQLDMFTSPEKQGAEFIPKTRPNEPIPEVTYDSPLADSILDRAQCLPRGHRSPERLPGTQALMETWSPWSTVKKPITSKRASFVPSLMSKQNASSKTTPQSNLRLSVGHTGSAKHGNTNDPRHSSLRFSISTAESPSYSSSRHTVVPPSMTDSELLADTTEHYASSAPPRPSFATRTTTLADTGIDFMNTSFAATAIDGCQDDSTEVSGVNELSSFQAAQLPHDSYPERTLKELATELLSTADMGRALSQV